MIDINFYQKSHSLKKRILNGENFDKKFVLNEFRSMASSSPVLYNIETTNYCPATCIFCPRTTHMTRDLSHLDMNTFMNVVKQISPFSKTEWGHWVNFIAKEYGVNKGDMNENHFFTNVVAKCLTLHQYGEPLVDPYIIERIEKLNSKELKSYFSCNPGILIVDKMLDIMESGLDYIKFSIDSVYDDVHKELRGKMTNFSKSYKKILELLDKKENRDISTTVVITMIDLNRDGQKEEFEMLQEYFKNTDVYLYLKSQDQTYLQNKKLNNPSIDWSEFCLYPWSSLSIKSDGKVAVCNQDFNNMVVVGDANKESLFDIWHGDKLKKFREEHINNKPCTMCNKFCNKKIVGEFLK